MADGSAHNLYHVVEATYGVTPNNPALETVRITGTTLGLDKDSLQSEEIRSDRQITDFRQGANQVNGDINFELSYTSFDNLLQGVMFSSDWAILADTGVGTFSSTATPEFTRASGSFVDDGFKVGQTIISSGFSDSNNNGRFLITNVVALTLSVTPLESQTPTVEAGTGDEQIVTAHQILKSGTTRKYFSFVRHFSDIIGPEKGYYIFKGCEVNQLQLSIAANAMVTGTMSVIGKSQSIEVDLTSLGTPTFPAATTTTPMDSFTGALKEGGSVIAVITEISLTLQNGLEPRFVVGSKDTIKPSAGRSNLTGQITAYFEDSTLVEKFVNETESSIEFSMPDADGNDITITIPRIKYTGGKPDVTGEGPITLSMPFQALKDPTEVTNMIIQRTPAA